MAVRAQRQPAGFPSAMSSGGIWFKVESRWHILNGTGLLIIDACPCNSILSCSLRALRGIVYALLTASPAATVHPGVVTGISLGTVAALDLKVLSIP
jgi:hypothetical protein